MPGAAQRLAPGARRRRRLSSTTSTRRRSRRRSGSAASRRTRRRPRHVAATREQRQAHHELAAAAPRPSLSALDRAAVQLDQAAHDGQPEAEPALRAIERLRAPARTARRRAAAARASMPMPVVAHAQHDVASPSRATATLDRGRPGRCTSRRWSAGSRRPARAAPRSPSTTERRPARCRSSRCWRCLEQRARDLDRRVDHVGEHRSARA